MKCRFVCFFFGTRLSVCSKKNHWSLIILLFFLAIINFYINENFYVKKKKKKFDYNVTFNKVSLNSKKCVMNLACLLVYDRVIDDMYVFYKNK
ncbi:hypothetical protein HanXRQr2_Chr02g0084571 [Helianthus annuus]|uniref:Uncharacterized protein n=1 Tax=Helianthus annuus TaxID=4232 RepID=A0A9K3JSY7_HELAN|nr:hypothetical protein HanXRQr2_Chr02g0084571 [Helianthus annuus]